MYLWKAIDAGGGFMDLGYWLYMNEAEGYDNMVSTRLAKINAIGRELRDAGYSGKLVPAGVFMSLCEKHQIYDINDKEIAHIEKEWL